MTEQDERIGTVAAQRWDHPEGGCHATCSPGAYPGAASGDLVHEDMRVQGCADDEATFAHFGVRRWDTVAPDGHQTTYPAQFILETTGIVEWTLAEARQFLCSALSQLSQAETAEHTRQRRS